MKKGMLVLTLLCLPAVASAADGPKKPSVCADFEIKSGKRGDFAVCYDSKTVRTFTDFSIVEVSHPAGGKARYLLGF
jgi:hypothetical protein